MGISTYGNGKTGRGWRRDWALILSLRLLATYVGFAPPAHAAGPTETTVTTANDLTDALAAADDGDTIIIGADIKAVDDTALAAAFRNYAVEDAITIQGSGEYKVYGSFTVYADGAAFDSVNVETLKVPFSLAENTNKPFLYSIGGPVSQLSVKDSTLSVSETEAAGTLTNGYLYNGIRVIPMNSVAPQYEFTGNTISGIPNATYLNCAIIIGVGASEEGSWNDRYPLANSKGLVYSNRNITFDEADFPNFDVTIATNTVSGEDMTAAINNSSVYYHAYMGEGGTIAGLKDAISDGNVFVDGDYTINTAMANNPAKIAKMTLAQGATLTLESGGLTLANNDSVDLDIAINGAIVIGSGGAVDLSGIVAGGVVSVSS
jgi:hypothetical protein